MSLYVKKPIPVDISEPWLKPGDHPNVKSYEDARDIMLNNRTWYTGVNIFIDGIPYDLGAAVCIHCGKKVQEHGLIETLARGVIVCPGDRIITGVKGEQYPIKPDIFEQTYEPYHETWE